MAVVWYATYADILSKLQNLPAFRSVSGDVMKVLLQATEFSVLMPSEGNPLLSTSSLQQTNPECLPPTDTG